MNGNGAKLGAAAALFARRFDAGLADWIAGEVAFPDTLVDSITPATDAAHLARARGLLGVDAAAAGQREGVTQWGVADRKRVVSGKRGSVGLGAGGGGEINRKKSKITKDP